MYSDDTLGVDGDGSHEQAFLHGVLATGGMHGAEIAQRPNVIGIPLEDPL